MSDEWISEREVVVHHLVISNSLWPQWTAAHQTSLSFTISKSFLNSCPLRQGCHPTISSSLVPFSSCPQSFPASTSFPVSQLFTSCGQRIKALASPSVNPMNVQGWFPLGLTGLISFLSKGLSRVFSNTTVQKHQFFMGMQNGTATLEDSLAISCKLNILLTYGPAITFLGIYPNEVKTYVHTKPCTWMCMPALFIIAKTWNNQDGLH